MEILQDKKFPFKALLTFLFIQGFTAHSPQELSVLVGADVTLSCIFHKLAKQVEWSTLTVEWIVDKHGVKSVVYTLVDGEAHINRAGSVVDEMWLLQSDASLKLCNVTVGDEGVYTCRIIQPVVYTETVSVKVLARPSVSLPETAAVMEGQEKTVQCNITGYYPDKLDVTWHIQNGSNTFPAGTSRLFSVCTNMAAQNSDGTYSIRSGITLHSSVVKNRGIQLLCRVEHQTLSEPYNRSVTLTVQAPSLPSSIVRILIGLVSSLTLGLIITLIGGFLMITRHFSEDPPSVSQITPNIIYAEVPTQLQCSIHGEKKKHLKVTWFRVGSTGTALGVPSESCTLLVTEELSLESSLKSDGENHVSMLPVCLSVEQDMTKYLCVVKWKKKTISRETTVLVKVEPSLLQISSIPQIPRADKQLVLCCRVENFYPADVNLVWSRDDSEKVYSITHFGPFPSPNHLYSMWSKIELLMAREDERVVYTCRIYHSSFPDPAYKDVTYHINTEGTAPDLKFIECDPQVPQLNKECTLHLCIEGFCPETVTVIWTKNGEEVSSGVFNTPPSLNISGLYSMFTFLKFTPTEDDKDAEFRCRVVHSAQKEPGEERVFRLPALQVPNGC